MTTLRQEEPPVTIFRECWEDAAPHHCFPDNGEHYPAWVLTPDGNYYWWDAQSGTLAISGLEIPLTTRWILCPAHQHIAQEDMKRRDQP